MLRINLLPAYIKEQRLTRLFIVAFSFLFAGVTAGMLFWWITFQNQVKAQEQAANEQEVLATQVTALVAETQAIRDGVLPIRLKRDFADAVLFYNGWKQKVYRRAAQYTTPDVEYSGMQITGDNLAISARAKKLRDIGKYFITMFGNPDVKAVAVSGVPGWTDPQAQGANTGGGFPGGGGDSTDSAPPMGGGSKNAPPAIGPTSLNGPSLMGGGAPPSGFPPMGGVGGTRPTQGFPFTVNVQLIQAITMPDIPAQLLNGGVAGGPGAGGFAPGGFPGAGYPSGAPVSTDMPGGAPADMPSGP